jgi:L-amino acid N-acyltransferase YncA
MSGLSYDLERLLKLALRDPFLGHAALQSNMENITPIVYKGHTVGFAVPFREKDGYWRTGSIFIEPAFRRKGIAHAWIEEFMEGKAGRAWIDPRNASSIAAYTAAGFTKSGRRVKSDKTGNWFDEYLTEEAGMESKLPTTLLTW